MSGWLTGATAVTGLPGFSGRLRSWVVVSIGALGAVFAMYAGRRTAVVRRRLVSRSPATSLLAHGLGSSVVPAPGHGPRPLVALRSKTRLDGWVPSIGVPIVIAAALGLASPPIGVITLLLGLARPILRRRRRRVLHRARVERELPDFIELVALAVEAGCNPLLALRHVQHRTQGPIADAMGAVLANYGVGVRLADALDELPVLLGRPEEPFESVRPLVQVLGSADRYGTALLEPLLRLATDARVARRQQAEAAARRLPIKLLFPLISCVLPAFALLTVAPLLASGLRSLRL